ncbi:MAG TPA: hypothetical protein VFM25_02095 [Verrucomicrobiae bacterium]|nr:hypothetical protein [Verrucomicrobiae bacterium]
MKTPREILFERHRTSDAKLDSIRQNVLAAECRNEFQKRKQAVILRAFPFRIGMIFWRELILPARRIWVGFAVVWMVIFALNAADKNDSALKMAKSKVPPAEILLALQRQQEMLAEFNTPPQPEVAEKPKSSPKPRSALRSPFRLV